MKFKATREALIGPLQRVSGVIEKRQTLPILAHVLMQVDSAGRMKLTGTDLEIQMTAEAHVETVEHGDITLPARKLLDVCRLLPDGAMVTLDIRDEKAILTSGRSRYSMATMPADNYPAFDGGNVDFSATVPAKLLKRAIEKTQHAMAIADVRYYLNGLLIDFDGQTLRLVSSDGHRLALYEDAIDAGEKTDARQAILPRKGVLELFKLLKDVDEPVTLNFSPNTIGMETDEFGFSAKLIEGRFPDFNRVMPRDFANTLTVDTMTIRSALARVAVLTEGKIKGISLAVKNGVMTLQANAGHDDALEELDVVLEGDGLEVGFNATYLLDSLSQIESGTVTLAFPAAANACLIQQPGDGHFKAIAMPMKL